MNFLDTVPMRGAPGTIWGQTSLHGRRNYFGPRVTPLPFTEGNQCHNCVNCGWPIKSTAVKAGRSDEGDYKYRHTICPTSQQRAVLRAEALA